MSTIITSTDTAGTTVAVYSIYIDNYSILYIQIISDLYFPTCLWHQ